MKEKPLISALLAGLTLSGAAHAALFAKARAFREKIMGAFGSDTLRGTALACIVFPTRAHVVTLIPLCALLFAAHAQSTPINYSETVNGELPIIYAGIGSTSPVLNLDVGQNTVSGKLSSWGDFDHFAFTVPQSTQLNSISLAFSQSTAIGYPQWGLSAGAGFG